MNKVYILVECDVNAYPDAGQAEAGELAKDRVEAALINDCDRLSWEVEDTPWFDLGNGGMTVSKTTVISNFTINLINEDEKIKARLSHAQKKIDESIEAWKELLERGVC